MSLVNLRVLAAVAVFVLPACGGGGSSTGPSGGGNPSPVLSSPVPATTITISGSGVSPNNITVAAGSRVTFVNQDSRTRDISSNPHPTHTQCPAINEVGQLQAGQSRSTGTLSAGTCGYHDHNDPDNTAYRGQIVIQ
jgi:plastocyanin